MSHLPTVRLLEAGESASTPRVRLTVLDTRVLDEMPWLEAALAPEWGLDDLLGALGTSEGVQVSDSGGTPIGLAVVRLDAPREGEATLPFLGVDPERRFRGLGGEAGIALDGLLREKHGVKRVYAPVPEGRGLAVYFWLRLGFRPLSIAAAPNAPLGLTAESMPGIWMLRDTP